MKFDAGARVVCIDDNEQRALPGDAPVVAGTVYTVRGAVNFFGREGLLLVEIVNPNDRPYAAERFKIEDVRF